MTVLGTLTSAVGLGAIFSAATVLSTLPSLVGLGAIFFTATVLGTLPSVVRLGAILCTAKTGCTSSIATHLLEFKEGGIQKWFGFTAK